MRTSRATGKNLCNVKNVLMMSLNQNLNKYPEMKEKSQQKPNVLRLVEWDFLFYFSAYYFWVFPFLFACREFISCPRFFGIHSHIKSLV